MGQQITIIVNARAIKSCGANYAKVNRVSSNIQLQHCSFADDSAVLLSS